MSNILGNMPPVFGSGYRGVVPAPSAADVSAQNILRADGTWGAQATSGPLPSQTGNAGELLTTDGTNASWASSLNTFQFGDVTLGTSGPSVKSSLSARAPRQGLVMDGSTTPYLNSLVAGPNNSDFTVAFWLNPTSFASSQYLLGNSQANSFYIGIRNNTGAVFSGKSSVSGFVDTNFSLTAGKTQLLVRVKNGSSVTFYLNGVAVESGITDNNSYPGSFEYIGGADATQVRFTGFIAPLIYNRALSASEVVALYEAGAPAGADYNSASNTSIITGDASTFDTDNGYWSKFGSATIDSGGNNVCVLPNLASYIYRANLTTVGKRYRITIASSDTVLIGDGSGGYYTPIVGGGSLEFVATGTAIALIGNNSSSTTIDTVTLYPLGLLLAPDAAQAGGGLVWYDTSGNAANISWTSGVSWNVPSSRVLGGNWTTSGTLGVSGNTATIGNGTAGADSLYLKLNGGYTSGTNDIAGVQMQLGGVTAAKISLNELISDTYGIVFATYGSGSLNNAAAITGAGNLLIGTTTDGGQKLQVSGSGFISGSLAVGDRAAPAGVSLRVQQAGSDDVGLEWQRTSATNGILLSYNRATSAYTSLSYGASSHTFTISGTTALTLDSSQNATFAGNVNAGGASNDADIRLHLNAAGNTTAKYAALWRDSSSNKIFHLRADGDLYTSAGATITGALAIGNTVQTAAAVASTHKVTISIGGTTYYLLATNV